MKVAIYARHSSDKQENSTRDQIARCEAFCQVKGYSVAETFCDEALSGSTMRNRTGLRKLLEAALDGGFTRILTEDLSRLSRDQGDIAHFYKRLLFLGITLETIAEGEVSELHIGLKGTMNALYLKDLSDKTKRGVLAAITNGAIPGGKVFGYDTVRTLDERGQIITGVRKVNEREAEIVRRIFREFRDGKNLSRICIGLNRDGILSPRGTPWRASVLAGHRARQSGILLQTLYKGVVTFGKSHTTRHPDTGKKIMFSRPEREWLKVPAPELAIIDAEEFDQTQQMLQEKYLASREVTLLNTVLSDDEIAEKHRVEMRRWRAGHIRTDRSRKQPLYLTSGKLHCGRHGIAFNSLTAGLYGCPMRGCANRNMQSSYILPIIVDEMKNLNAAHFQKFWSSLEYVRREKAEAICRLRRDLDQERIEIRKLLNIIGRNSGGVETVLMVEEREKACARLRFEIQNIESELSSISPVGPSTLQHVVAAFHAMRSILVADHKNQVATAALHPCIISIVVNPKWDDVKCSMKHTVEILFDLKKLIEVFSPSEMKQVV